MKVGILYVKGCAFGVGAHLVSDYVTIPGLASNFQLKFCHPKAW